MNKRVKAEKGITLIALVVTVVVLLILAAITIPLLLNGGIIDRAKEGVTKYKDAEDKEKEEIDEIIKVGNEVEETGSYTVRAVDSSSGESLVAVTLELYDSSFNFIKSIYIDETGLYDGSSEELPIGTYYLNPLEVLGYNIPEGSTKCKILPNIINEWEVSFTRGELLPSSNCPSFYVTEGEDEVQDYERTVTFNAVGPANEDMDGGMIYDIYEIATYNRETGKYEYNEEFRDIISTSITIENFMKSRLNDQIVNIIREKNITPVREDEQEGNIVTDLRKDKCYIIVPRVHNGQKYIIKMMPSLLPCALMNGYGFEISWSENGYELVKKQVDIEITNAYHNTHVEDGSETFVYKVTGYVNGEEACSRIASMHIELSTYEGIQRHSTLVELPIVPDEVEVEQIYGGTCFTCETPKHRFELGGNISSVEFSNESTRSVVTGSAFSNVITYNESEGGWSRGEEICTNSYFAAIEYGMSGWKIGSGAETNLDSPQVLVRMKFFTDAENGFNIDGDLYWSIGEDGYFHYVNPLNRGEKTENIEAQMSPQNDDVEDGHEIHTVIVLEVAEAKYREDGTFYADWNTDINY